MKPIDKARNLAKILVAEDQNNQPLVELLMEMYEWCKEDMLQELENWKDYYLNNKSFKAADALDEIITWFRSPEI